MKPARLVILGVALGSGAVLFLGRSNALSLPAQAYSIQAFGAALLVAIVVSTVAIRLSRKGRSEAALRILPVCSRVRRFLEPPIPSNQEGIDEIRVLNRALADVMTHGDLYDASNKFYLNALMVWMVRNTTDDVIDQKALEEHLAEMKTYYDQIAEMAR